MTTAVVVPPIMPPLPTAPPAPATPCQTAAELQANYAAFRRELSAGQLARLAQLRAVNVANGVGKAPMVE